MSDIDGTIPLRCGGQVTVDGGTDVIDLDVEHVGRVASVLLSPDEAMAVASELIGQAVEQ